MLDVKEGQRFAFTVAVPPEAVDGFAAVSGDTNPLHMDTAFAQQRGFTERVAHGALLIAYVSRLVGMRCPGRDALIHSMGLEFRRPVYVGDTIVVEGVVEQVSATATIVLRVTIKNAATGVTHARGTVQAGITAVVS